MKTQTKILIFLASALLFGYTYAFDIPQALEAPLRLAPYHYNNFEFNLLYFFQFLPVALLQIPLGVVIDKYPVKKSLFFFAGLSMASVVVAGLAFQFLFTGYKWVVNGSRSVFGMCGEAQFTVQAVVLAHFAKEDYQISMGICLTLPFVFDALNSVITTHVYDLTGSIPLAWYIGGLVCLLSLISGIIINRKYLSKIQKGQQLSIMQKGQNFLSESRSTTASIQATQQLIYRIQNDEISNNNQQKENQQFDCRTIFKLGSQFWVVCASIFFFQASLGPFFDNLNDLIVKRFNIAYTDAGKMLILTQALMVFFGYGLSKICAFNPKWRRKIILFTSISYFACISLLYLLPNTQAPTFVYYIIICIFLIVMSTMYACEYCALVGSTTYFVPKSQLGTAYGVAVTALGTCQCLMPLVNSTILNQFSDLQQSYTLLSLFAAAMAAFPVVFAAWMMRKEFQILDYNLKDDFITVEKEKKSKINNLEN